MIIALNIAATIAHHLTEPDLLKKQSEEEAFSKIEDKALEQISEHSDMLASELAPKIASDWMQITRARYKAALGKGRAMSPTEQEPIDLFPHKNGKQVIYASEQGESPLAPKPGEDPNGKK